MVCSRSERLILLTIVSVLAGCVIAPPTVEAPAPRMCSGPIGTAYVEEPSSIDKIRNNYPRQEIERLLIETNCFKLIEGGLGKNDPMRVAQEMMKNIQNQYPNSNKSKEISAAPRADYRISTSVVFAEAGANAGYNPYLGYNAYNAFRADRQNGRATIKLIDEKTDAVVTIATGEGVYQDTQWNYMGPATDRSTNRVLEFAFKNAINNLVGQVDHMSRR